jgi:hypothetical protein
MQVRHRVPWNTLQICKYADEIRIYIYMYVHIYLPYSLALLAYEVHVLAPLSRNLPLPADWPYAPLETKGSVEHITNL